MEYNAVIETAITKMQSVTDEGLAIRQARTVPDLEIDDDGAVSKLHAPGKDVLRELVEAYKEIMGDVAASLIAYAIRDDHDTSAIDLPENITEHL